MEVEKVVISIDREDIERFADSHELERIRRQGLFDEVADRAARNYWNSMDCTDVFGDCIQDAISEVLEANPEPKGGKTESPTGFRCPECGNVESFRASAVVLFGSTTITPDGWDYTDGSFSVGLADGARVVCDECCYEGPGSEFTKVKGYVSDQNV